MDVFFTDCSQVWSQHKQKIRSDILMEPKQVAQSLARVRCLAGRRGVEGNKRIREREEMDPIMSTADTFSKD